MRRILPLGLLYLFSLSILAFSAEEKKASTSSKEITQDGYILTFEILPSKTFIEKTKKLDKELAKGEEAMLKMDKNATHHFFITLTDEKSGKEITDAKVKIKVIPPKEKAEIKTTMYMTNHFCHNFKLSEAGKYEIIYWVKIKDKDLKGGFYWEI